MFLNLPGVVFQPIFCGRDQANYQRAFLAEKWYQEYKVNYLDNTSDFVSPDDFDGVEVILEQL